MNKQAARRAFLTGGLLIAVTTIGCGDQAFQPEDTFRSDAGSTITPPTQPRIEVVRDGNTDTPRDDADGSGRRVTPPTPPRIDVIQADEVESQRR